MNLLRSVIATTVFEFKRSVSAQRLMLAGVLAFFPPVMLFIILVAGRNIPISDLLIVILVGMVSLLAQLLWATPNIYSELEGKSWIFLASRPRGRIALYLGKYISSVLFSFLVCTIAITGCLAVRTFVPPGSTENPFFDWVKLNGIALIACAVYSSILSLIGSLFYKRAMVLGAAYLIMSEGIIANVPAIISRFTPRLHLQGIALNWLGWIHPVAEPTEYKLLYGDFSVTSHLVCLAAATLVLLVIGSIIVTTRQYITADET